MLENTDSSIQEISSAVGFGDVSVFRREFRSFYAATPTEYRDNHKKKANASDSLIIKS